MRQKVAPGFVILLLGVSGCGEVRSPSSQAASPELLAEAPRVAERATASPGKTSSPIGIHYELLGKPAVGQPLQIRITTRSNLAVDALSTEVRGDDGVYVAPASTSFAVARMRFDEPVVHTLTVTPLREGSHRVSVIVQGEIDGALQASHVSIPIQVGDVQPEPKPMGTMTTDEAGEAIISLPARQN